MSETTAPTREEVAAARALLDRSMAAWRGLAAAARADSAGTAAQSAGEMEPHAAQALLLALDRILGGGDGELARTAQALAGGQRITLTMDDVERLAVPGLAG